MIDNEVRYSAEQVQLIEHFLERENATGNDWGNEEFSEIKGTIKNHYKVEQGYKCPYCAVVYPVTHGMVWDIEHIVAKDKKVQFMFEPRNLCVACKDCNGAKSSKEVLVNPTRVRFPTRSEDYKIIHPHFDDYHEHINAITPGQFYRPLTEKGEFTIVTCRLLRFYGVVQREQPEQEINDLARVLLNAEGAARGLIEDELVRRIMAKRGG
ncbi:HNH endonuclease [Photobacterium leiognathi]|uniref:HNH endonuclease n=1 Tax=Photobacterium leiognathi TaxID=553611 RepID=UPI002980DFFD|nr:hypothetical protein [Photobacterium leiognathi]